MDPQAEVIYVDTRNAPDRRYGQHVPYNRVGGFHPMSSMPGGYPGYPHGGYPHGGYSHAQAGYPHGALAQQAGYPQSGGSPVIVNTSRRDLIAGISTGALIDMVAQAYAALQSLPSAPVATGDAATDIGNSLLYQTALAQHAKRDEQVRTIGSLVSKLIG
jgi:hypothetical protein